MLASKNGATIYLIQGHQGEIQPFQPLPPFRKASRSACSALFSASSLLSCRCCRADVRDRTKSWSRRNVPRGGAAGAAGGAKQQQSGEPKMGSSPSQLRIQLDETGKATGKNWWILKGIQPDLKSQNSVRSRTDDLLNTAMICDVKRLKPTGIPGIGTQFLLNLEHGHLQMNAVGSQLCNIHLPT